MTAWPRLVVTRPAREAAQWVQALADCDIDAVALPLIDVAPAPWGGALAAAHTRLGECDAVMFVSANAVRGFLRPKWPPALAGKSIEAIKTRAWSTGPGTSQALRDAGWPADLLDEPAADAPQFDSEALWACVQAQIQPGLRVLIVRGGDAAGQVAGRDWLYKRLQAADVRVEQVVAYTRAAPALTGDQLALARTAVGPGWAWLFSSSEAIGHLRVACPVQDWSQAKALATHPRIAQAARDAGFGVVCEIRPDLEAVVASIKSRP